MKTIENIEELIWSVDDHTYVEVTALKLRYLIERLTNAETSNDILRHAQRNQAMASAEMQRENERLRESVNDATKACERLQDDMQLAESEAKEATRLLRIREDQLFKEKNIRKELQSKLDEAEKQEPIGIFSGEFHFKNGQSYFSVKCFDAIPEVNSKVYAKPIPAQQSKHEIDTAIRKQSFHRFNNSGIGE